MSEAKQMPFHSFNFTLVADKRPRAMLRMKALEDGMYELHVERGSASNPSSQFTREVPLEVAERLRDVLQDAGAFGWDEAYGDATAPGSRRWTLNIVFKEGVFALSSKGGSDAPAGFDAMLEELYRLDFPRPEAKAASAAAQTGGSSASMLQSMSPEALQDMLGSGEAREMMDQMQRNPQVFERRMKEEFRRMSPDEQNRLIDTLVATGMGDRAFWERFFRG